MNGIYTHKTVVRTILTVLLLIFAIATMQAQAPTASFSQDKTKGCLPLIVQFTNLSTGNGLSYYWDFGNGNTSAVKDPGAIYTTPGNHTVKLKVTDAGGKVDSVSIPFAVQAFGNPEANFTADARKGCAGQQILFTDSSTTASAPIKSWQWNFGDGNPSLDQNPRHAFVNDGLFSVSLIVTDTNGCKNYINKAGFIKTTKPVQVNISADNTGGCALPLKVKFSNKGTLQPGLSYNYLWKFGNGDSSAAAAPAYTYISIGNYDVGLTLTDDNNCVSAQNNSGFISLGKTTADFSIDTKIGCAPHTVNLKNIGKGIPSDATITWYFGNGDSAVGDTPVYTYQQPGTYSITMVVTSPGGCNDVLVKNNVIIVHASPQATFAHGATVSCTLPFTINFSSVNASARSWQWSFGDGDSSILKNPTKVYKKGGVYDVTLTITDMFGCSGTFTKSKLVRVKSQSAYFVPSVDKGCVPVTVNFTNNSSSYYTLTSYSWDLGNGQTATTKAAQTTYTQPGVYRPRLIITDNNGCADTMVYDSIRVGVKTKPDFMADKTTGCKKAMNEVQFTNLTDTKNQKIDAYYWDFGVITSTDKDPLINYNQFPRKYNVRLVTVSNGCADTIIKTDYINILMPHAQAKITEDPCKLDTLHIEDNSKGGHIYQWAINGNVISNNKKFDVFLQPGTYKLDLYVKDTVTGCQDDKSYPIEIHQPLKPGFITAVDSSCTNVPVMLADTTTGSQYSEWLITGQDTLRGATINPYFSNPGYPVISLVTTDVYGCKEKVTENLRIKVIGPDFTPVITPDKGCFPLDAKLIKTGSSVYGVAKAKWYDNLSIADAIADTVDFTLKSIEPGMNTAGQLVYLSVTDNIGCEVTRGVTVKVSKPVAAIANVSNYYCDHTSVYISHDSAVSMHIGSLQYHWVLDGAQVFSGSTFTPDFYKNATPTIKLVVTEPALGCVDSSEITIPVSLKKLKADFSVDKTRTTCPPMISTFTDASVVENTTITNVKWSFGDTSGSIVAQPQKTYFYPGNYAITYIISDAQGCTDSITLQNKIQVGGPQGNYVIDRYKGCVPFDVNFTAQSQNAKTINWDMGNGQLSVGSAAKGNFTLPGTYKPSLVLEDSFNCLVVYPVKDPIVGYEALAPDFTFTGKCINEDFIFTNTTDTSNLSAEFNWTFDDGKTQQSYNALRKFDKAGKFNIILEAKAPNGCVAVKVATTEIKPLAADFDTKVTKSCRGAEIQLINNTNAGAGVKSYRWVTGDGNEYTAASPKIAYKTPGRYAISLFVEDNNGCKDSLVDYKTIAVFDTVAPAAPAIYRVTVEPDNTTRLEFKPYRDDDFSYYHIYRSTQGQAFQLLKMNDCQTDTVYTDKAVNTFGQTYTYKIYTQNFCGNISAESSTIAHTSILLQTMADTNLVTVNWNAYEGWNAVHSYHIYRKAATENSYSKIATVPATQTSYADDKVFCGNKYEYIVYAEREELPVLMSSSNQAGVQAIYKPEVYPAKMVRATVEDDRNILIEFSPNNKQKTPVDYFTVEKSIDGVSYTPAFKTSGNFNWLFTDNKVDVHNQSYHYRVRTTDICAAVSEPGNIAKSILLQAKADADDNVDVQWSQYKQWEEGIMSYELEQQDAAGNYTKAATNNAGDTTYYDAGNFNNVPSLCYRVKAVSNNGTVSYSNTGCVKGRSSLFVPNAFTPNNDVHNNLFVIVGAYIKKFEINIYNRYGEKVFASNSLDESWDGTYKGEPVQDGAYLYVITSLGLDNKNHNVSGTVTLLR